jgi:carbamoyl-phosphate synthase/aspartate carbamoyltransferase
MSTLKASSPTRSFPVRPALSRLTSHSINLPASPVTFAPLHDNGTVMDEGILELVDGSAFRGISFGAEGKSVAGECVFQTGKYPLPDVLNIYSRNPFFRYGRIY